MVNRINKRSDPSRKHPVPVRGGRGYIRGMDSNTRTLAKALTWNALGITVMTVANYPYTGSLLGALRLAVSVSFLGVVSYLIHEKAWNAVRWGRRVAWPDGVAEPAGM